MKVVSRAVLGVVFAALLVDLAAGHTWLTRPRGRAVDNSGMLYKWDANHPPCADIQTARDGTVYNSLVPRVTDSVTSNQQYVVEWFDEHCTTCGGLPWPNCNDQAQFLHIEYCKNPTSPQNCEVLASVCAADLTTEVTIPDWVTDTYTLRMRWNFLDQSPNGSPLVFYSCADVNHEGNESTEEAGAGVGTWMKKNAWYFLTLAIIPIAACILYGRRQQVVSQHMTRMTAASMMSADSNYADAKSGRLSTGSGGGKGGRSTLSSAMSGTSTLTADRPMTGISGITAMTRTSRGSRGSNASKSSAGSRGRQGF